MSDQPQMPQLAKRPAFIALAGIAVALALAGLYLIFQGKSNVGTAVLGDSGAKLEALAVGAMANMTVFAPEGPVEAVVFSDGAGVERHLEEWRGKTILINLWATWCGPCRHEMPSLDRLQASLGSDDFEVLAISLDRSGLDLPREFYVENKIESLKLYNDATARTGVKLGVFGMPTTVLIDADGRLIGRLVGPAEWDAPEAFALIRAAIAQAQ